MSIIGFLTSKREDIPQPPKKQIKKPKNEDIIIKKLQKGNKQATNMPIDELNEWAQSLCIESELKEWYLNPDFAVTK
jgi:hypothetical protein